MSMPQMLQDSVFEGLQRLLVLRLPGSPAGDTLTAVARIWVDALVNRPVTWLPLRDLPRIKQAFRTLEGTAEKWPNPATFMQCLPAVVEPLKLGAPRNYGIPQEWKDLVKKLKRNQEQA